MFIGDGTTSGGIAVSTKNLGSIGTLFGTYQNGFSLEAINTFTSQGASIGDFIYDRTTRNLYSLSSVSIFPPLSSDLVKYDTIVLVNTDTFQLNNNVLYVKQGGIKSELLNFNVVDGITLEKPSIVDGLRVKLNSLGNGYLAKMDANTVKCNPTNAQNNTQDLVVGPSQFIGRTPTSSLTALPLSAAVRFANIAGINGITIDTDNNISLDSALLSATSVKFKVLGITEAGNGLTVSGGTVNLNTSTNVNANSIFNGSVRVSPGNTLYTRTVSSETTITNTADTIFNGIITVNNNGGSGINTINGATNNIAGITNINGNTAITGGLTVSLDASVDGTIYCTNDIVAFSTSDKSLKENIQPISNSLNKLSNISGYSFNWKPGLTNFHLKGNDIGLLAQELEAVMPEAVNTRKDGTKAINYNKVIPLLVQCIKELESKVSELKDELRQRS
jgi:hypothetical protein